MRSWPWGAAAAAVLAGAAAAVFFRRRRHGATLEQRGPKTDYTEPTGAVDDVTLARTVETEIFRDDAVPKGQIDVNAEYGVVYLRGEAPSEEMVQTLIEKVRAIDGVQRVESLLSVGGDGGGDQAE